MRPQQHICPPPPAPHIRQTLLPFEVWRPSPSPCVRSVNVTLGPKEDRLLITGLHTVADIYCNCCQVRDGLGYSMPPPV